MKLPYSYTSAKAEGLRLEIMSEEQGFEFNPICRDTLRQAAEMGDVDAAKNMAALYYKMGDIQGFLHWLKIADEAGNIDATCRLFDWAINPDANWDSIKYYAQRIINAPYIESKYYKDHLLISLNIPRLLPKDVHSALLIRQPYHRPLMTLHQPTPSSYHPVPLMLAADHLHLYPKYYHLEPPIIYLLF